jgi:hypothetical protein
MRFFKGTIMSYDYNDDRPAGIVYFDGKKIYLRPAVFDKPTQEMTESLFHDYGARPMLLFPSKGATIPAKLMDGFPMQNPDAFIYEFDPKPLKIESGPKGELDPRKLKDNFIKLNNRLVSMRELAMAVIMSRVLMNRDLSRK